LFPDQDPQGRCLLKKLKVGGMWLAYCSVEEVGFYQSDLKTTPFISILTLNPQSEAKKNIVSELLSSNHIQIGLACFYPFKTEKMLYFPDKTRDIGIHCSPACILIKQYTKILHICQ